MTAAEDTGPEGEPSAWDRTKQAFEPVTDFHAEHPAYFWLALIGSTVLVFLLGALLWPELFVEQFLWKNFWGPTVADANQSGTAERFGVHVTEEYTLVAEIVYGLVLAGALLSIYQHLFKKRGIAFDARFIAALLPYILFGPIARVLQDASMLCQHGVETVGPCEPGLFSWLFISPFIYMVAGGAVIVHLLMAHATREETWERKLQVVGGWLGVQAIAYVLVFAFLRGEFTILLHPITVGVIMLVSLAVYAVATYRGGAHVEWAIAAWGVPMALVPTVLVVHWELVDPWVEPVREAVWQIAPWALGAMAVVVGLVWLVGTVFRDRGLLFVSMANPLNLTLVAGHMIDAFATFGALCTDPDGPLCQGGTFLPFAVEGYGEKHPVSEVFLGILDGWGFVIMKLVLVLTIVWLVDRAQAEGEDPDLVGLVKLAVLVLGLGPGLRNLVRVFMGV